MKLKIIGQIAGWLLLGLIVWGLIGMVTDKNYDSCDYVKHDIVKYESCKEAR